MASAWEPWHTSGMSYPRSQLVPPDEPGNFHVVTRCVRRAFLCGTDQFTGRSFEHRRQWIEDRIQLLADSFAVSVFTYAVMSNHTLCGAPHNVCYVKSGVM